MVRVSADAFLSKVTELYDQQAAAESSVKGSIALTCKSVPAKKLARSAAATTADADDHVLLFRVVKYGNNKHKKKYSTTVAAAGHATFHTALSHIVKTKVDVAALKEAALRPGAMRVVKTSKKTTA